MSWSNPNQPNLADYASFLASIGIRSSYLPADSPWIGITFNVALSLVNQTIQAIAPNLYTLAVYNLAADRLINFAPDQDGSNYFEGLRSKYGCNSFTPGVVTGASDQGTSGQLQNIEAMKRMTFQDLQYLKTPWGRQYMAFAQMYGPNIWGLS